MPNQLPDVNAAYQLKNQVEKSLEWLVDHVNDSTLAIDSKIVYMPDNYFLLNYTCNLPKQNYALYLLGEATKM